MYQKRWVVTAAGRPQQEPGYCCMGSAHSQTQQQSMFQGVPSTNTTEISFSSVIKFKNCEMLTIISIGDIAKLLKKMKNSSLCLQEQPPACCAAQAVSAPWDQGPRTPSSVENNWPKPGIWNMFSCPKTWKQPWLSLRWTYLWPLI